MFTFYIIQGSDLIGCVFSMVLHVASIQFGIISPKQCAPWFRSRYGNHSCVISSSENPYSWQTYNIVVKCNSILISSWYDNEGSKDKNKGFFFTFGPSASCRECICNRSRPWSRPYVSDWGCGVVILLSRGEFGSEKIRFVINGGCLNLLLYAKFII